MWCCCGVLALECRRCCPAAVWLLGRRAEAHLAPFRGLPCCMALLAASDLTLIGGPTWTRTHCTSSCQLIRCVLCCCLLPSGVSARRRKQELERLNEQLRTINTQLRCGGLLGGCWTLCCRCGTPAAGRDACTTCLSFSVILSFTAAAAAAATKQAPSTALPTLACLQAAGTRRHAVCAGPDLRALCAAA